MLKKSNNRPLVSVGLPVFNGSKEISRAIEGLLNQTYENMEIIISDNASTDNTLEICEKYAKIDSRIKIYRNETNIGVYRNGNRVRQLSQGEYYMLQCHDDFRKPEFVAKCLDKLLTNPNAVLCISDVTIIEPNGNESILPLKDMTGQSIIQRVNTFFCCNAGASYYTFGLMPLKVLRKTGSLSSTPDADRVYLAKLLLLGEFIKVEEPLFFYYRHIENLEYYLNRVMPSNPEIYRKKMYTTRLQDIIDAIKDFQLDGLDKKKILRELVRSSKLYCELALKENGIFIYPDYPSQIKSALEEIFSYSIFDIPINKAEKEILNIKIHEYFQDLIKNRPLFLWGAGEGGCSTLKTFRKINFKVNGIIDNDTAKHGEYIDGAKIYSPKEVLSCLGNELPFIIITSITYGAQIQEQLEKYGYVRGKDFI